MTESTHCGGYQLQLQVLKFIVGLWALVIVGLLILNYLDRPWTETFSFRVADGWCQLPAQGLGRHCFGDFGTALSRGRLSNTYQESNIAATNTPVTSALFEVLRLLPYNVALTLYLLTLIVCLVWPLDHYFRIQSDGQKRFSLEHLVALTFVGIGGVGTLASLDRGNHIAMLVPFFALYFTSLIEGRDRQAVFALVAMSILKFWGIMFVVALVGRRKHRQALIAVLMSAGINILGLIPFPGDFISKFSAMRHMVLDRGYSDAVLPYSLSISGLLRRAQCAFTEQSWCDTSVMHSGWFNSRIVVVLIGLVLLAQTALLIGSRESKKQWIGVVGLCILPITAVPDAPAYTLAFAIPLFVALAYRPDTFGTNWLERSIEKVLIAGLVASVVPLALGWTSDSILASGNVNNLPYFRLTVWLIPLLWAVFHVGSLVLLIRQPRT